MASAKDASENSSFENQVLGTIYGNCIGDAIGLLTEFMSKREADKVCKPCIHVYMWYTDISVHDFWNSLNVRECTYMIWGVYVRLYLLIVLRQGSEGSWLRILLEGSGHAPNALGRGRLDRWLRPNDSHPRLHPSHERRGSCTRKAKAQKLSNFSFVMSICLFEHTCRLLYACFKTGLMCTCFYSYMNLTSLCS